MKRKKIEKLSTIVSVIATLSNTLTVMNSCGKEEDVDIVKEKIHKLIKMI